MKFKIRKQMFRLAALTVSVGGCAHTVNLLNTTSPKFEGEYALAATPPINSDTTRLKVVSFNIKLADRIGPAIEVLRESALRNADVFASGDGRRRSGTNRPGLEAQLHLLPRR